MSNNQALVLFSGGQDSTTCLFWARKKFDKVSTIGFDYGQRHHSEIAAATKIAAFAHVSYEVYAIDTFSTISKNSLTNREIEINEPASKDELPNTLVEGRSGLGSWVSLMTTYEGMLRCCTEQRSRSKGRLA